VLVEKVIEEVNRRGYGLPRADNKIFRVTYYGVCHFGVEAIQHLGETTVEFAADMMCRELDHVREQIMEKAGD